MGYLKFIVSNQKEESNSIQFILREMHITPACCGGMSFPGVMALW